MTPLPFDQTVGRDAFGDEHTEFRRFVCWSPDRVSEVMDTEALQTPAEVFLATHSPIPLYRGNLTGAGGEAALSDYDEEKFLHDFLAPDDYAFVAVLGGAGTGKSHLIRWLSTRIPKSERRRVLLIPRAGTSLHEILRRILEGVEGARFDDYRQRLTAAGATMSLDEARVRLLENLAIAVGRSDSGEAAPTDEEDYLASELPHLLRDPVFRTQFLLPDGVLDRLATHIVGGSGVERIEERRTFTVQDLPLAFADVGRASRPAQDIYRILTANPTLRPAAVAWLNRHVDEAVAQLMRMGGTDLLTLMIDVRAALAASGIELVVLIEDLATLQGIDQQLLEALIIRPRQPDMPEMCALRTAVAMTSGYYDGLRKNVHQRFDFRVVMGESDTRGAVAPVAVERFTARYLNAARLAPSTLATWYRDGLEADEAQRSPVPSACSACRFRGPCHATFGAHDGMGLYPFTATAVANILGRVSPAGFNPRIQLKEGYKPILENDARALHDGRFPPPELLQRLGHSRLGALAQAEIRRRDPASYQRRAVLLDVWSDGGTVRDLDHIIHQAFDLPPLGIEHVEEKEKTSAKTEGAKAKEDGEKERLTPAEAKLRDQLRVIDAWRAGEMMSQDLATSLREVVHPAVVSHVDWNALHLIPGDFVGNTKAFRQANSIVFARQFLTGGQPAIKLPIPLRADEDPTEAALALQGLLLFRHHRSWRFSDGSKYYRAYLRQIDAWANHVLDQIDRVTESDRVWDPVPGAVELLAVGARILGRPRSRDPQKPDLVDALFADPPDREDGDRSPAWQGLIKLVRRHQAKVQEVVLSRVACSKGDSRKLQVIDAAHILPTLSQIRRTWRPAERVPGDITRSLRFLLEYRQGLEELLEQAVVAERAHQLARYDAIAEQIDATGGTPEQAAAKRAEVVGALRRVLDSAASAGVLAGAQRATLDEKLTEFEGVQLQAWAESVAAIRGTEEFPRLLAELSLVPGNTGRVSAELVEVAEKMLTATEANVRRAMAGGNDEAPTSLDDVQRAIGAGLDALIADLSGLAGVEVAQ